MPRRESRAPNHIFLTTKLFNKSSQSICKSKTSPILICSLMNYWSMCCLPRSSCYATCNHCTICSAYMLHMFKLSFLLSYFSSLSLCVNNVAREREILRLFHIQRSGLLVPLLSYKSILTLL